MPVKKVPKTSAKKKVKKSKKKPVKFRQIKFKLTDYQKKALDSFCKANQLTPVRFMKTLVNEHVERYRPENRPKSYVTPNQLKLFSIEHEDH